mgnify:CR=1 FL=1|jgi:hypothetical protein
MKNMKLKGHMKGKVRKKKTIGIFRAEYPVKML